jgi:hypothetical protein
MGFTVAHDFSLVGLSLMPFGNSDPESQRDSVIQPRVASLRATLGKVPNDHQPQRGCVSPLIFGQFEFPKGIRIKSDLAGLPGEMPKMGVGMLKWVRFEVAGSRKNPQVIVIGLFPLIVAWVRLEKYGSFVCPHSVAGSAKGEGPREHGRIDPMTTSLVVLPSIVRWSCFPVVPLCLVVAVTMQVWHRLGKGGCFSETRKAVFE